MRPFLAIVRKQITEARWFLGLVSLAMATLGWLGVYQTKSLQVLLNDPEYARQARRAAGIMMFFGGPNYDGSTLAMEIARWNFPFVPLLILCWAIARGSASVAGEIERGTLDVVLSRPISRAAYLSAQIIAFMFGLALTIACLVAGNWLGNLYFQVEDPPTLLGLLRPSLNLFALGVSVFGYTILFSSFDVVRWRSTLIGSALTIAGVVGYMIANAEEMRDNWGWLEWFSVFRGYAPVEAAVKGVDLKANVAALCGVGIAGILLAFGFFGRRDLPANS